MTMRSTNEDAYFAASNSKVGFYSYYGECFDTPDIRHLYAIKGGPGTGKSRFLREVSQYAVDLGWQCEYVYCSSDPDSLDGIILSQKEERIALLDATAPHVYEPLHPGVREDIINLGEFWNVDVLSESAEEIERLSLAKGAAYRKAYRYLSGMGEMEEIKASTVAPYVRKAALSRYAKKMTQGIEQGKGFSARPALMRSVGMRGTVGFDTYFAQAESILLVEDCRGAAQYLMAEIFRIASEKRASVRVSHDPVLPDRIDGIFFCDSKIVFAGADEAQISYPHRRISMRRFVDTAGFGAVRWDYNYAHRMSGALLDGAVEALAEARRIHFALEEIYMSAMDFEAKEEFTKSFCSSLFGLQKR